MPFRLLVLFSIFATNTRLKQLHPQRCGTRIIRTTFNISKTYFKWRFKTPKNKTKINKNKIWYIKINIKQKYKLGLKFIHKKNLYRKIKIKKKHRFLRKIQIRNFIKLNEIRKIFSWNKKKYKNIIRNKNKFSKYFLTGV